VNYTSYSAHSLFLNTAIDTLIPDWNLMYQKLD